MSLRGRFGLLPTLLGSGGLVFFTATVVANLANFVFHVAMSRMLGPATYGALGSLLGLATVVTLALSAIQVAVTQAVAVHRSAQDSTGDRFELGSYFAKAVVCAGCVIGLAICLAPVIDRFLHLASPVPFSLFGAFIALCLLTVIPQGVLVGQLRFTPVAVGLLVGTFARLGSGMLLVKLHMGLDGAVAASAIGAGATLLCFVLPTAHQLRPHGGASRLHISLGAGVLSVVALGGVSAFLGIDSFLARHYLSPVDSGYYVAAATGARMALFLPGAVATLVFPRFAAVRGRGSEVRGLLLSSLLLVIAMGGLATAVILLFPHLVIAILFGSSYRAAAGPLEILAVGATGMGLLSILVYYHLARRSGLSVVTWVGVLLSALLIATFHSTLDEIAWSMFAASCVVVLVMSATALAGSPANLSAPVEGQLFEPAPAELDLTIVVPYYNPGVRLRATVDQLDDVLGALGVTYEIITVSDGSTDGSEAALNGCPADTVRSVRLDQNVGKGEALRVGLAMGRGRYLGFIDADGDLPASQVAAFVALTASHEPDIVLGSKRHPMSEVVYPPLRHLYSWAWQFAVLLLFRLKVKDTQTGLKLIRREVLAAVLPRMLEKRFAFDLELLVVANRLGYKKFFEAPVRIQKRFGSTVSMGSAWGMFLDLLAIYYRLHFLRYYDDREQFGIAVSKSEQAGPTLVDESLAT